MSLAAAVKSTTRISWKPTGTLQQTLTNTITKSGIGLHSGNPVTVTLFPELAGKGRFFDVDGRVVGASIDSVVPSALCTTLCGEEGVRVRTIEHLVSALEATGVDNCRVEIRDSGGDRDVEVPILDGSSKEWVEAIEQTGLEDALDGHGNVCERMAPFINEPVSMWRDDSFVAAFPSPVTRITYGINFPQDSIAMVETTVPMTITNEPKALLFYIRSAIRMPLKTNLCELRIVPQIGCQWFSSSLNSSIYSTDIAPSRTFCVYEQVEKMQNAGLIKGGSVENAIICSASKGWLNPPLRFDDEPCRHKVLDLIGDLSLFARGGSRGILIAHIIGYKAGHSLHADFVRCLSSSSAE